MTYHKKTSTSTHEKETRQDIWPQERLPVTKRNYARQEMHYRSSLESPRSTPFRDGPATTHLYRHTVQQQSHLISARNAAPTIGPGPCIQGDSPARCREFRFKDEQPVFHQFRLESPPPFENESWIWVANRTSVTKRFIRDVSRRWNRFRSGSVEQIPNLKGEGYPYITLYLDKIRYYGL